MKYEKEFREDNPETIGETDREFDKYNYIEWIDAEYKELKEENTDLNISIRKVTDERDSIKSEYEELLKAYCELGGESNKVVGLLKSEVKIYNNYLSWCTETITPYDTLAYMDHLEAEMFLSKLKDNQEKENEDT